MEAIKTINLTKKYKDIIAVNNLNLTINKGELFALLGVNGAGKSTTIKMLSTLTKPTSGEAIVGGFSIVSKPTQVKSIISVSPQETAIAANLTVKENLELICGIYDFDKEKKETKIKELSNKFNLSNMLNKKVSKLSGGYKRRLSIAMALISEPKILFLDEPTLGLDVIARSELWNIINSLKGEVTILLTTHYMEEAETLSDRVGIMKNGKLLVVDTVDNLMKLTNTNKFEQAFIHIVRGEDNENNNIC